MTLIVAISLMFSFILFQVTTRELANGLRRQADRIVRINPPGQPPITEDLENYEIHEREHAIALNLIYFNLIIFGLSAVASYGLAKRTLGPIEEAHDSQKRFTADASHELRTPLAAIKMETEVALLDNKAKPATLRNILKSNLEEINKLTTLTDTLLRLSQQEANQPTVFEKCNLNDVVQKALEQTKAFADHKQIKIKTNLKNVSTNGDPQSLTELLVILLDNAIKYSPPNTTIAVSLKKKNNHAWLTVEDEGKGINPEDLTYIFDRFYRVNQARSRDETSGFGLGLSIAQQISKRHGGNIEATSTVGKGSIFSVELPLA